MATHRNRFVDWHKVQPPRPASDHGALRGTGTRGHFGAAAAPTGTVAVANENQLQ